VNSHLVIKEDLLVVFLEIKLKKGVVIHLSSFVANVVILNAVGNC
jgi:hypothetical protein